MTLPRLLLLTDRSLLPSGTTLIEQVQKCLDAGASHIVLRELDLPEPVRSELAQGLAARGATVISARALIPGAAGVHRASVPGLIDINQPQGGFGSLEVNHVCERVLVGRSCHSVSEVRAAASDGCDYATLGPFAPTASKPGYEPSLSRTEYSGLPLPTYALGGITQTNAASAVDAGAAGVAVMGAVMRTSDPAAVVRDILKAVS